METTKRPRRAWNSGQVYRGGREGERETETKRETERWDGEMKRKYHGYRLTHA